eukprot:439848-Rhodomonas_salina.1
MGCSESDLEGLRIDPRSSPESPRDLSRLDTPQEPCLIAPASESALVFASSPCSLKSQQIVIILIGSSSGRSSHYL